MIGVWDFNEQSGWRGDFIVFLMNLQLITRERGCTLDGIYFVSDPRHPNSRNARWKKTAAEKLDLVTLALLATDNVLVFSSAEDAAAQIGESGRWPEVGELAYGWLSWPHLFFSDSVPALRLPGTWRDQAREFMRVPYVTLNLRHNPRRNPDRNSDPETWRAVVSAMRDVTFVMIGTEEEAAAFDFGLPNQVFAARASHRTIGLDCGLVGGAQLNIFCSGGMEFVAAALHRPLLSWFNHLASPHPANRIRPEIDGCTPRYLISGLQRHWPHIPSAGEAIAAIRARLGC